MQVQNINGQASISIQKSGSNGPNLKAGNTIEAKVISIEDNIITLQQADGTLLKAENLTGMPLSVGDTVTILIGKNQPGESASGNMVAINGQPVSDTVTESELQLTQIGQSASENNVRLAALFAKYHFPFSKTAFENLEKLFELFPQLDKELAVFMASHDIEPTEANVQSLQSIGQLHQEIQTIVDDLNEAVSKLPLEQFLETPEVSADKQALPEIIPEDMVQSSGENTVSQELVMPENIDILSFLESAQPEQIEQQLPQIIQQATEFVLQQQESQSPLVQKLVASVVTETVQMHFSPDTNEEILSPELQQLLDVLPESTAAQVMDAIPSMQALTNKFLALFSLNETGQALFTKVDEQLSGDAIRTTLQNTPAKLLELGNLKLTESWQQAANSIKLGEQSMTYLQIPMTILQKPQTAELYILKRNGKQKKAQDESTKVVFALNTQHIGRFESIITANRLDLSLHIRLENQKIKTAVDSQLDVLKDMLGNTKYNLLTLTTSTIEKKITVANAHEYFGYKQLDIRV